VEFGIWCGTRVFFSVKKVPLIQHFAAKNFDIPSDPYYSLQIRMYLSLKCVYIHLY
jgi:hypothetical protein